MANFGDYNSMSEGAMFIFGPWVCTANGLGGNTSHLTNPRKLEASSEKENLDETLPPASTKGVENESIFDTTSTCVPPAPSSDFSRSENTHTKFPFGLLNTALVYQRIASPASSLVLKEKHRHHWG